jgi:16S rRNA (cytosine967-C5)-methyltransferase
VPGVTPARVAALDALRRVQRGNLLDRAFAAVAPALDARDRAWLQELLFGVVRLRGRVDHYLTRFVRGGLESLDPVVLDVLRLGAYQLLEMGGVPPYAAVSQSVDLVREAGMPRAAGLVNGVLQSLRRGWRSVEFPVFEERPIEYLTTWGSHPRWLVERWAERWGYAEARQLVEANNRRPDLFIRPVGMAQVEAVEWLARAGVGAEPVENFPESVRILPPSGPAEVLAAIPSVVQDPAAAIVVRYADLTDREFVIDLSAAPGGKAVGFAGEGPRVIAADASFARIQLVRSNVDRIGLRGVDLVVADGKYPPFRSAPAVFLDAPCTGTGTFRRHPDGRWRISERDLNALAGLQRELLASAASLVEVGGLLIYSTCSLEPEENEHQVQWLLDSVPGFRPSAPRRRIDGTMMDGGYLRVLPQRHGVDGAFAARLERIE